jgi:hypothetical protein
LPHGILQVFNTILYKNEFQNPQILMDTLEIAFKLFDFSSKIRLKIIQSLPGRVAYQFVHKGSNHNVFFAIAGKLELNLRPSAGKSMQCCMPSYGRKKACNSAGLRPVIKLVIFLQGCRTGRLGKAAGQG